MCCWYVKIDRWGIVWFWNIFSVVLVWLGCLLVCIILCLKLIVFVYVILCCVSVVFVFLVFLVNRVVSVMFLDLFR